MKLAEALAERSECQTRIEALKKRLTLNARIQEGEAPAENPGEMLIELNIVFARLLKLIRDINRTNGVTAFDMDRTISDAIAERDVNAKKRDVLTGLGEAASTRQDRYSKSEVRFVATVPVGELQKEADRLSREYRMLDTRLQQLNWQTELVEA